MYGGRRNHSNRRNNPSNETDDNNNDDLDGNSPFRHNREIQFGRPIKINSQNLVDLQTMKINLDLTFIPENASGVNFITILYMPF